MKWNTLDKYVIKSIGNVCVQIGADWESVDFFAIRAIEQRIQSVRGIWWWIVGRARRGEMGENKALKTMFTTQSIEMCTQKAADWNTCARVHLFTFCVAIVESWLPLLPFFIRLIFCSFLRRFYLLYERWLFRFNFLRRRLSSLIVRHSILPVYRIRLKCSAI